MCFFNGKNTIFSNNNQRKIKKIQMWFGVLFTNNIGNSQKIFSVSFIIDSSVNRKMISFQCIYTALIPNILLNTQNI